MSKEAWENQEKIFHEALCLTGEERESFLLRSCDGNEALRSEIESLLEAFENEASFLDEPVFEDHLALLHQIDSDGLENSEIGTYRIRSRIGEGGMGKVFDATDVRLNRRVALKFLSESFDDDNLARRRLLREAQAAAMLDHPNICAIYGVEQVEQHHFIAMQYIDGLTLADFIKKTPVDRKAVSKIFRQIVSAVAFAHSHGIIHRDLKPANIMIRDDGQIKVLDFGLAKNVGPKAGGDGNLSSRISQNGLIIGTVSYMSPEQLRGERLDFQTDIFSIGIILYELLSGKNPFARKSQAETIAAVLGEKPAPLTNLDDIPDDLSEIVRKCLEKDKAERFQSAVEILVHLETSPKHYSKRQTKRKPILVGAVLLLIAILAFTAFLYLPAPAKASRSLAILPITNESSDPANDYLSDGLTESLTSGLAGIKQLKVTPSTIAAAYKTRDLDPVAFGKEMNVDYLMKSEIRDVAGTPMLEATLLRTDTGKEVWKREFSLDSNALINTQEILPQLIAGKLQVDTNTGELETIKKRQTSSALASQEQFKGRFYLNDRDKKNIDMAITAFTNAKDADPLYALAWAGLAEAYVVKSLPSYGSMTPRDAMLKAKEAVKQALELDPDLCAAHTAAGLIKMRYDWDFASAEKSFKRAIEIDPDFAPAHYWYSYTLFLLDNPGKGMEEARKAKDLAPLARNFESNIARMYYFDRDPLPGIPLLKEMLVEKPAENNVAYLLGLLYLEAGQLDNARLLYEKYYPTDKLYFAAQTGYTYGRLNRKKDALSVMNDLREIAKEKAVPPQEFAIINLGMGEKEKGFDLLMQSCHDRYPSFPTVIKEFFLDPYRTDERFPELQSCVTVLP